MEACTSPGLADIFPGLVDDDDAAELYGLWATEDDMADRCTRVSRRALERGSRREWHWTLNLVKEIQDSWTHINGLLVREGVTASKTGFPDYLDAAYTVFQQRLDKDGWKAFEARLRKLPTGGSAPVPKPRMSSRADLMAFAKD